MIINRFKRKCELPSNFKLDINLKRWKMFSFYIRLLLWTKYCDEVFILLARYIFYICRLVHYIWYIYIHQYILYIIQLLVHVLYCSYNCHPWCNNFMTVVLIHWTYERHWHQHQLRSFVVIMLFKLKSSPLYQYTTRQGMDSLALFLSFHLTESSSCFLSCLLCL